MVPSLDPAEAVDTARARAICRTHSVSGDSAWADHAIIPGPTPGRRRPGAPRLAVHTGQQLCCGALPPEVSENRCVSSQFGAAARPIRQAGVLLALGNRSVLASGRQEPINTMA